MFRKLLLTLTALLLLPALLLAQTGKVRGKVTDKETGEALIGANVVVVGTSLGAATNVDGEYVILPVTVGTYDVTVTYIGYQPMTISNVRVNANLSTEVNFAMNKGAVSLGVVEVVAERPLINKSATSSVRITDSEFLVKMPSRGVNSVVALSPGVVSIGGNFYIRGGRADETGFTVEGANITDVVNGGRAVSIVDAAIEQVQVLAGGYSAEYGGANSGMIRTDLKTGGERMKLSLLAETDDFTSQGKKTLGTYSYGYRDLTATAGGTLAGLKLFGSWQNTYYQDPSVRVWDGANFQGVRTYAIKTLAHPLVSQADTINIYSQPGNPIGGYNQANNLAGTIASDLGSVQVRLGGGYSFTRSQNQTTYANIFNQARLPINENTNGFGNLRLTQFITPTTFYEASFSYTYRFNQTYDPKFGWNLYAYGDTAANAAYGYKLRDEGIAFDPYQISLGPASSNLAASYLPSFNQYGTPITGFTKNQTSSLGGRLDFTTQLKSSVELKVGGEYNYYTFRTYTPGNVLQWARDAQVIFSKDSLAQKIRSYNTNNIGYDEFGNSISSDIKLGSDILDMGPRHPVFGAAYVQSKIELSDIVMNIGVRYDYINSDGQTLLDPHNVARNDSLSIVAGSQLLKTPATSNVTPRIGFSFPVTDRTVFHAQYGKFIQFPSLSTSYRGIASTSVILRGGNFFTNTTGYGLRPERTTSYEIGFSQQISDNASLDITAFYKDILDQIQYQQILPSANATNQAFPMFINGDFATTKGLEVKFQMRRIERTQLSINYTLSDARGTGSSPTTLAGTAVTGVVGYLPKFIFPLEFNQVHNGNISLDYRFAKGDGGPVLEQLGINVLANFNSGTSFTRITNSQQSDSDPRNRVPVEEVGASSTPWFFQLDGRIDKSFQFGQVGANVYIYVQNILGTNNVVGVYRKTGSASDDGWLGTTAGQQDAAHFGTDQALYEQMYRALLLGNNTGNYGPPRQIRFGVKLEY